MKLIDKNILDELEQLIKKMGKYSTEVQSQIIPSRKLDNSKVTEADITIDKTITAFIKENIPNANIISEEFPFTFDDNAPYSFVLDPIDGTDVYSQGLPSYAIALGILDENRTPVGSMIYAPRFGIGKTDLFIRLDPDKELLVDGKPFIQKYNKDKVTQITMGSSGQKDMNFSSYKGKLRTFGSSILHMVAPVIYSDIQGCVNQPCYIWDTVASHAVLLKVGMDISFVDGTPFVYDDSFVIEGKPFKMPIYCGTEKARSFLKENLPYISSKKD